MESLNIDDVKIWKKVKKTIVSAFKEIGEATKEDIRILELTAMRQKKDFERINYNEEVGEDVN